MNDWGRLLLVLGLVMFTLIVFERLIALVERRAFANEVKRALRDHPNLAVGAERGRPCIAVVEDGDVVCTHPLTELGLKQAIRCATA